MNRKQPSKRPPPSHKDGKLRDKRIADKMSPNYTQADFDGVLRKAVTKHEKR